MKPIFLLLLSMFLIISFSSCGPSQREKAVSKMNEAKKNVSEGDTLKAIDILASIPSLFPKARVQIEVSKNIIDELYRQLIDTKKEQLSFTEIQVAELEKNFKKEKTEFDLYTQYIPNRLSFNRLWNKSFLQVILDERGEIFLTSNYMGKEWLKHTSIRVYDEGLQIKTSKVPLDDPDNRESDFLDYKWEKVSYTNGKSDSTIRFIAENSDRKLKCAFIGMNYYYILLEDYNIAAIKNAFELSCAIKKRKEISLKIKELEAKRE